jgi:hypothetical protein
MMLRLIGGIVAGLVIWMATVTVLNLGLRHGLPGYAAVEAAMTFTLPMLIARFAISAVASVAGGYGAALLAGWGGGGAAARGVGGGWLLLIVYL